jgi:acetyl-CoA acetyltransferase family protein
MFEKVEIPYGAYWSTPFAKWQGSLSHLHSLLFAAHVARHEMEKRKIEPAVFDHGVFGMTTPQQSAFHGLPWFMSEIGAPQAGGTIVSQACATGARCISSSAQEVELGMAECSLSVSGDRTSNAPLVIYPNPYGVDGVPDQERWFLDNIEGARMVPFGDVQMVETAENCAREWQITTDEQHDVVARRFEQYEDATADDHAFQKRYMSLPFEVPDQRFRKTMTTMEGDEGIYPTNKEKLAKLKPVREGGTVTLGGQTHPADGGAAMVITGPEKAKELSADPNIQIRVLSVGQARTREKFMPAAPVPAAQQALDRAGLTIDDIDAIKSHNPFVVNDIVFARETGFDVMKMNNYGSSLIWGHPNGPTGMRAAIELIEELALRGGGTGLFEGCAAGDLAMAVVLRVDQRKAN